MRLPPAPYDERQIIPNTFNIGQLTDIPSNGTFFTIGTLQFPGIRPGYALHLQAASVSLSVPVQDPSKLVDRFSLVQFQLQEVRGAFPTPIEGLTELPENSEFRAPIRGYIYRTASFHPFIPRTVSQNAIAAKFYTPTQLVVGGVSATVFSQTQDTIPVTAILPSGSNFFAMLAVNVDVTGTVEAIEAEMKSIAEFEKIKGPFTTSTRIPFTIEVHVTGTLQPA